MIAIIALLIAILLPTLNKARSAMNRTTCLSNARQIFTGIQLFMSDHKGRAPGAYLPLAPGSISVAFPPSGPPGAGQPVDAGTGLPRGVNNVGGSLGDPEPDCLLVRNKYLTPGVFVCPEIEGQKTFYRFGPSINEAYHYSMNVDLVGTNYNSDTSEAVWVNSGKQVPASPITKCRQTGATPAVICGPRVFDWFGVNNAFGSNNPLAFDIPAQSQFSSAEVWPMHGSGRRRNLTGNPFGTFWSMPSSVSCDRKYAVVVYMDGHGEATEPEFSNPKDSSGTTQPFRYRIGSGRRF